MDESRLQVRFSYPSLLLIPTTGDAAKPSISAEICRCGSLGSCLAQPLQCSFAGSVCTPHPRLEDWEIVVPTDEQVADFDAIQELCGEEVNAESFEKGLRNRMSRIGTVLKQAGHWSGDSLNLAALIEV